MGEYLVFQSIVQYRIPIDENGKAGNPEILKKWTTTIGQPKKRKKVKREIKAQVTDEVVEL